MYAYNSDKNLNQQRGPKNPYVAHLEERLKEMTELLSSKTRHCTEDVTPPSRAMATNSSSHSMTSTPSSPVNITPAVSKNTLAIPVHGRLGNRQFCENSLETLTNNRFFGMSSGFMLMKNAYELKAELMGQDDVFKRPEYWSMQPVRTGYSLCLCFIISNSKWERASERMPNLIFPESSLLTTLVSLYFAKVNVFLPLIHAPTFNRSIAQGLHYRYYDVGATVLLVCAIGARYSSDPRVLYDMNSELSW
ncbi:hypothetical protein GYMLUDRAFT_55031 [Collybiopsis luxurians FD-317 M1]|nr:hypothetical protein GYMLUDRAFT_55031 [Collybiopsis luxurians FD-317 M1]